MRFISCKQNYSICCLLLHYVRTIKFREYSGVILAKERLTSMTEIYYYY